MILRIPLYLPIQPTAIMLRFSTTILLALLPIFSLAQDTENTNPNRLFSSTVPIDITIQMDMQLVLNDTSEDPQYSAAKLIQKFDDNKIQVLDIKVKSRGNTRRNNSVCEFPPIKLNFKKESTLNTVFEGQDKLKMVTHCQESGDYQNYAILEYLAYKAYNLLTDYSYRVRLVNVIYQDTDQNYVDIHKTGFLIEDDDILAERIGGIITERRIWSPDSCEQKTIDLLSLFQFMIGNTDWWIHTRHNIDIVSLQNNELIPIPYDFDYSGIINAPYAIPSVQLPIRSVRERFFKGSCKSITEYEKTIDLFNSKNSSIVSLIENADFLDNKFKRTSLKYIEDFYQIINDQSKFNKYLNQTCEFLNIPPDKASVAHGNKTNSR